MYICSLYTHIWRYFEVCFLQLINRWNKQAAFEKWLATQSDDRLVPNSLLTSFMQSREVTEANMCAAKLSPSYLSLLSMMLRFACGNLGEILNPLPAMMLLPVGPGTLSF